VSRFGYRVAVYSILQTSALQYDHRNISTEHNFAISFFLDTIYLSNL
jgi:hypothetical protein